MLLLILYTFLCLHGTVGGKESSIRLRPRIVIGNGTSEEFTLTCETGLSNLTVVPKRWEKTVDGSLEVVRLNDNPPGYEDYTVTNGTHDHPYSLIIRHPQGKRFPSKTGNYTCYFDSVIPCAVIDEGIHRYHQTISYYTTPDVRLTLSGHLPLTLRCIFNGHSDGSHAVWTFSRNGLQQTILNQSLESLDNCPDDDGGGKKCVGGFVFSRDEKWQNESGSGDSPQNETTSVLQVPFSYLSVNRPFGTYSCSVTNQFGTNTATYEYEDPEAGSNCSCCFSVSTGKQSTETVTWTSASSSSTDPDLLLVRAKSHPSPQSSESSDSPSTDVTEDGQSMVTLAAADIEVVRVSYPWEEVANCTYEAAALLDYKAQHQLSQSEAVLLALGVLLAGIIVGLLFFWICYNRCPAREESSTF